MINLQQGIKKIQELMIPGEQYYLVGGAVRDAIMSNVSHDLDIVCTEDTRKLAKKLANQISGAFYVLDEERNACRVISRAGSMGGQIFDFTQLRGTQLEDDLLQRDFTINAMAVDLRKPDEIIDPLKGGRDLAEKRLRACTSTSFQDDPLRVARAVRYSVKYGLKIEKETLSQIKQAVEMLDNVSKERRRDELIKMLENGAPWVALGLLEQLGALPYFVKDESFTINQAIPRVKIFCDFFTWMQDPQKRQFTENLVLSSFITAVNHLRKPLLCWLSTVNQSERSRFGINLLTLLFWEIDLARIESAASVLALSNEEINHIQVIVQNQFLLLSFITLDLPLESRTIYQYFKQLGDQGVDLVLLWLSVFGSQLSSELNTDQWIKLLEISRQLVDAWINHPEVVNPKPLLNGKELMFEFDLPQGPLIGKIIDEMREEQAAGSLTTKEQAMQWIDDRLHSLLWKKS